MTLLLALVGSALGADCATPYTSDNLLADVMAVEGALRGGDDASGGEAATKLKNGLACLNEPLPSVFTGRTLRAVGAGLYASGDTLNGTKWFITAAEVEQTFDYGMEELPAGHPIFDAWVGAKGLAEADEVAVDGKELADGKHWLDGRKWSAAKARTDRPHLYQRDDGAGVQSWIIDGNSFPAAALAAPAVAEVDPKGKKKKEPKEPKVKGQKDPKAPKTAKVKEPKQKKQKTDDSGAVIVGANNWPIERVIATSAGGGMIIASGILYGLSAGKHKDFEEAKTVEAVEAAQGATNRLWLASVSLGAAGVGTLGFSALFFIIDGQPVPAVRVRF